MDRTINNLKENMLVSALVFQKTNTYEQLTIIINKSPEYIKEVTGIDYFKDTNELKAYLDKLYIERRKFAAISNTSNNLSKESTNVIMDTINKLSEVEDSEKDAFEKLINELIIDLNERIKTLFNSGISYHINTNESTILDESINNEILFDRFNILKKESDEKVR